MVGFRHGKFRKTASAFLSPLTETTMHHHNVRSGSISHVSATTPCGWPQISPDLTLRSASTIYPSTHKSPSSSDVGLVQRTVLHHLRLVPGRLTPWLLRNPKMHRGRPQVNNSLWQTCQRRLGLVQESQPRARLPRFRWNTCTRTVPGSSNLWRTRVLLGI